MMRALRKLLDCRIPAALILCALFFACNDTNNLHLGLRTSEYLCSDAPVALNRVALICGSKVNIDVVEMVVVVGGPTTAKNIKGLHFDVVYPRDLFSYVNGSAAIVANNFLTWGGGTCTTSQCTAGDIGKACQTNADCNVPGVNMPALSANETVDPPGPMNPFPVTGRLTITIDRANPADGVGATLGGQRSVLRFQMRANSVATGGNAPTPLTFKNAAAVNPADGPIASVVFKNQAFLWVE